MADFLFMAPTGTPIPGGCVERVCLRVPWNQPMAVVDPTNGQRQILNPPQLAWNWLSQQAGIVWPQLQQGQSFEFKTINPATQCKEPLIYCLQKADVNVEPAQVNAPYAHPTGNGHALTMPPQAPQTPDPAKALQHGQYDPIDPCGMANSADPLLGSSDGLDGTFSDTDFNGREELRQQAGGMFGRYAGPRPGDRYK